MVTSGTCAKVQLHLNNLQESYCRGITPGSSLGLLVVQRRKDDAQCPFLHSLDPDSLTGGHYATHSVKLSAVEQSSKDFTTRSSAKGRLLDQFGFLTSLQFGKSAIYECQK